MKSCWCQMLAMGRTAKTAVTDSNAPAQSPRRQRDRCSGMQNDTQRTVVGVGIDRMDVRHLDDGEQGEQRHTHEHDHRIGLRPRVAIAAHPCVKSGQIDASF